MALDAACRLDVGDSGCSVALYAGQSLQTRDEKFAPLIYNRNRYLPQSETDEVIHKNQKE